MAKGLGKGLGALLGELDVPESSAGKVQQVSIYKVEPNPSQPRRHFDEEGLQSLSESITAHGIVVPVADAPMPELLQENLTVDNLRRALLPLLADGDARDRAKRRLAAAVRLLTSDGDAIGRIVSILTER